MFKRRMPIFQFQIDRQSFNLLPLQVIMPRKVAAYLVFAISC